MSAPIGTDNTCVLHRHKLIQIQHLISQVAVETLIQTVAPQASRSMPAVANSFFSEKSKQNAAQLHFCRHERATTEAHQQRASRKQKKAQRMTTQGS